MSRSQLERVLAHQAIAERVKGVDRAIRLAVRNQHVDPRLHFLRGVVSERQCQDLARHERDASRSATQLAA